LGAKAFFLAPSFGAPPKRRLYEEWVRAGPWTRNQIDTSKHRVLEIAWFILK